jgi:hypothetical protein
MQRLGIGKHAGMLGIHVDRGEPQVEELRFGVRRQHLLALPVADRYDEEAPFAVGPEQGRGLRQTVQPDLCGRQVHGPLSLPAACHQAPVTPQRHQPGGL